MTAPAKLIEFNFAEDPARWLLSVEGASNLNVYDTGGSLSAQERAVSNAAAALSTVASSPMAPTICRPIGRQCPAGAADR